MANYTIQGKVIEIEAQTREIPIANGTRVLRKRYLAIDATRYNPTTGDKFFDNFPCFEFGGDNCDKLSQFKIGQRVVITFDVVGRKWVNSQTGTQRWINTLSGYKVDLVDATQTSQPQYQQQPSQVTPPPAPYVQAPPPPNPYGQLYAKNIQAQMPSEKVEQKLPINSKEQLLRDSVEQQEFNDLPF